MNILTTKRPWGSFTQFTHNEPSTVKLLYVTAGEQLSLQYHTHRQEFWRVVEGHPQITVGDKVHTAEPGEDFTVLIGVLHEISAPTDNVVILEVAIGTFDENDIVRVKDKYNRVL